MIYAFATFISERKRSDGGGSKNKSKRYGALKKNCRKKYDRIRKSSITVIY